MWDNPIYYKKYAEERGMEFSQLDAAYPMFEYMGAAQGYLYMTQAIRYASDIGAKYVDSTDRAVPRAEFPEDVAFDYAVKNYSQILKWCEDFKIGVNLETHGVYTQNPEFMLRLMKHFESEYIGMTFDTGNTFIAGNDPLEYLKYIGKYVKHIHIKDIEPALAKTNRGEDMGVATSVVPIGGGVNAENIIQCLNYLKEINWHGYASVECAGTEANMTASVEWIRRYI
jgi:sugar phosphate isomerase/epimerase